jgi:hypothetical protein
MGGKGSSGKNKKPSALREVQGNAGAESLCGHAVAANSQPIATVLRTSVLSTDLIP